MPVLGADPDAPVKEWDTGEPGYQPQFSPPHIRRLVDHFAYHRRMQFSQRCDDFDKKILSAHFGRMAKRGYSEPDLMDMVDRFFHTWGSEYTEPAPAFCSKTMQDQLTTTQRVNVPGASPELEWIANGMPSDGPFQDPKQTRKMVTLYGGPLMRRYPDVVADILTHDDDGSMGPLLRALSNLVQWNLGEMEASRASPTVAVAALEAAGIQLPRELRSGRRASPKSIRPEAATTRQAIGRIGPRKT